MLRILCAICYHHPLIFISLCNQRPSITITQQTQEGTDTSLHHISQSKTFIRHHQPANKINRDTSFYSAVLCNYGSISSNICNFPTNSNHYTFSPCVFKPKAPFKHYLITNWYRYNPITTIYFNLTLSSSNTSVQTQITSNINSTLTSSMSPALAASSSCRSMSVPPTGGSSVVKHTVIKTD